MADRIRSIANSRVPERFIKTNADRKAIQDGCYYDEKSAYRVIEFCEDCLIHVDNQISKNVNTVITRKPFRFLEWQINDLILPLFGWKRSDGTRRFRVGSVFIPKKCGKTTIMAALSHYMLMGDGEPNSHCYAAATVQKQSGILYKLMMEMMGDELKSLLTANKNMKTLVSGDENYGNTFQAISRSADFIDGISPHLCIVDELHRHRKSDMWALMQESQGGRKQSLVLAISTSGNDLYSVAYQEYQKARAVLKGDDTDISYFPLIYEAPNDADVFKDETLLLANPSARELPHLLEDLRLKRDMAFTGNVEYKQQAFRQLRLNQWTRNEVSFFNMDEWDNCSELYNVNQLKGKLCAGGLDLSYSEDLTAFALIFPVESNVEDKTKYVVLCKFYLPKIGIKEKQQKDGLPYLEWAKDGLLTLTPGKFIDYHKVRDDIVAASREYNIVEIGYDNWNMNTIIPIIEGEGIPMADIRMHPTNQTMLLKQFEPLISEDKLIHNQNRLLRENAASTSTKPIPDKDGVFKIIKAKPNLKIDGIMATIMAYHTLLKTECESIKDEIEIPEGNWVF